MIFKLLLVSITSLLLLTKSHKNDCGSLKTESECVNQDQCEWRRSKRNSRCCKESKINRAPAAPKNLIFMIADGLGPNYNAAYRLFKNVDETILDKYLVGTFSTRAANQTIIDSASSATALSTGILPKNTQIGTDIHINPISNIFEAAKEKGKGIGVISNTRVTHATPASFSSHVAFRLFEDLIGFQQGTRIAGDVDILFGGGKRYFDGTRNGNTFNLIEDYLDFGWNSLPLDKTDLLSLDKDDLPSIGLFTHSSFPDYLQRKYDPQNNEIPSLLDMTKKALELLDDNYGHIYDDGFMIMIESGQMDWGGHANDLPYLLNEIDEYYDTLDYIINDFIANRQFDDTLVVMVSDHDTGGLVLGRESHWNKSELIYSPYGFPIKPNDDTTQAQTNNIFQYDPLVVPSPLDELVNANMYEFFVEPAMYATRTAFTVALMVNDLVIVNDDFTEVFDIIQAYYIEELTQAEKYFIKSCYNRLTDGIFIDKCLTKIISIRVNVGWTTFGHTGSDIQIHSLGPYSDIFRGFNGNVQNIGKKLIGVFDLQNEIETVNNKLKDLFLSNELILCDNNASINYLDDIPWPVGNFKFPGLCYEKN